MLAGLLFVLNNFLAFFISASIVGLAFKGREQWRRELAVLGCFPVIIFAVVMPLGFFGFLNAAAAATVLLLILIVLLSLKRIRSDKSFLSVDPVKLDKPALTKNIPGLLKSIFVGSLTGLVTGRFVLRGTKFLHDDLAYHATAVGQWVSDGRISLAPRFFPAYYPYNAETLPLWFILPFQSDGLACLAGLYWWLLLAFTVVCFGKIFRLPPLTIPVSLFVVMVLPEIRDQALSFSAVDLACTSMVLAAIAMAVPSKDNDTRSRIIDAVFCGLFAGFALGSKVSVAPVCFLLFVWWATMAAGKGVGAKRRLYMTAAFVLAVLLTASVWYIRNIIITGNPLFPAELGPFKGPFLADQQYRTKLISWILRSPADWKQWSVIISHCIKWPTLVFVLSAVGYMTGCYFPKSDRSNTDKSVSSAHLLLFFSGLIMLAAFPFMPFSGTDFSSAAPLRINLRFIITPFVIGIIFFGRLLNNKRLRPLCYAAVIIAVLVPLHINRYRWAMNVIVLSSAFVGWMILKRTAAYLPPLSARKSLLWSLLISFMAGLAFALPVLQKRNDGNVFAYVDRRPVGRGWKLLEELPEGSVLTQFGISRYQYYPLFGRRYQFKARMLDADGKQKPWLHEQWTGDPENFHIWKNQQGHDYSNFIENLKNEGIDFVLVMSADGRNWPVQNKLLEESNNAKLYLQESRNRVYKIFK